MRNMTDGSNPTGINVKVPEKINVRRPWVDQMFMVAFRQLHRRMALRYGLTEEERLSMVATSLAELGYKIIDYGEKV